MARFKKGKSGNPGGRSKKQREIEELAQEALQEGTRNTAIAALREIMAEAEPKDRIAAAKLLMGYAYGNPRQRTEISGDVRINKPLREYSDEELLAVLEDGKPK